MGGGGEVDVIIYVLMFGLQFKYNPYLKDLASRTTNRKRIKIGLSIFCVKFYSFLGLIFILGTTFIYLTPTLHPPQPRTATVSDQLI